jgi:colicin import membrane protein
LGGRGTPADLRARTKQAREENNMAERQETSVMVSIQEILRDAQNREEQDKLEAERRVREEEQRRVEEVRSRQAQEQARLRSEEEDRQRRAFEEQKRQAEIVALQEAAVTRARTEAEAQARLAEMTARQEHERRLHAVTHDGSKKRLQFYLYGLGVVLIGLAVGGGFLIKNYNDKANAADARAHELEVEKDAVAQQQKQLQLQLDKATSPEERAQLEKAVADAKERADQLAQQLGGMKHTPTAGPVVAGPAPGPRPPPTRPACNCTPGDPLCSCL